MGPLNHQPAYRPGALGKRDEQRIAFCFEANRRLRVVWVQKQNRILPRRGLHPKALWPFPTNVIAEQYVMWKIFGSFAAERTS